MKTIRCTGIVVETCFSLVLLSGLGFSAKPAKEPARKKDSDKAAAPAKNLPIEGAVQLLGFCENGSAILYVTKAGEIRKVHLASGKLRSIAKIPKKYTGTMAYSPDGSYVLGAVPGGTKVLALNLATGKSTLASLPAYTLSQADIFNRPMFKGQDEKAKKRSSVVISLGVAPGGQWAFVGCLGRVFVYNLPDLELKANLADTPTMMMRFSFSRDGKTAAVAGWSRVTRGGALKLGGDFEGYSTMLRFNFATPGAVRLVRPVDFPEDYCGPLAVAPELYAMAHGKMVDGKATDWEVSVYRDIAGKPNWTATLKKRPKTLLFAPGGKQLLAMYDDGALEAWNVATGGKAPPAVGMDKVPSKAAGIGYILRDGSAYFAASLDKEVLRVAPINRKAKSPESTRVTRWSFAAPIPKGFRVLTRQEQKGSEVWVLRGKSRGKIHDVLLVVRWRNAPKKGRLGEVAKAMILAAEHAAGLKPGSSQLAADTPFGGPVPKGKRKKSVWGLGFSLGQIPNVRIKVKPGATNVVEISPIGDYVEAGSDVLVVAGATAANQDAHEANYDAVVDLLVALEKREQ